jgi:dUTP pyrophosphatase
MSKLNVKVKKLTDYAVVPAYQSEGASGFDLYAFISNAEKLSQTKISAQLDPNRMISLGTGLVFDIPKGYEMQIRSRSGMARKGLIVMNQPGTIDSDYRGEVRILLYNSSPKPIKIEEGMRVAQGVIAPVIQADLELVDEVSATVRDTGGFGSTDTAPDENE